ncbi:hypothetical protein ACQRCL_07640 [Limosilactobacillus reuteri]
METQEQNVVGQGQGAFKLSALRLLMSLVAMVTKLINDCNGLTERALLS